MNYKKIYDDLCSSRKSRGLKKESGYELHHIILRCDGGSDDEDNLVKLSYREHFMAHLLLAKAYPYNINYQLASVYFLKKKGVIGSRTYSHLKENIASFKRFQRYLAWSKVHVGRIKLSSFYDTNSLQLGVSRVERHTFRMMLEKYDIKLSKNNTRIHEEVFKVLVLINNMGYKGVYGWNLVTNRTGTYSKGKYAFNKVKNNFIKMGIIDENGDFLYKLSIGDYQSYNKNALRAVLKSDIETRHGVKGLLLKWNKNNLTKTITSYKVGDNMVLEPLTYFLPPDFKYSLDMFKPITYRKAKKILEYLLNISMEESSWG